MRGQVFLMLKGKRSGQVMAIFLSSIFSLNMLTASIGFGDYQKSLIFNPRDKHMADVRINLKNKLQDTYYYTLDGVKINAWYIKAHPGKPTIIYCHGQGENISLWQSVADFLADNGYGVFMIDYRGHGRSEGEPTETGVYLDLESSIKYLKDYEHISQKDMILWGRSLGGAIVADIASRDKFKGCILESTFTNIRDEGIFLAGTKVLESKIGFWGGMATKFVKYMPMTIKFDTENKINKIDYPLLIGASINDETVPSYMSKKLAELNPNAQFYLSKIGSHHESEWFKLRALKFIQSLETSQTK